MSEAPRTTNEAAAFLRGEAKRGSHDWKSLCQKLQRTARGIPAVWPSALSAAMHTPENERVYKLAALRRGMVAFSDHPSDSNPFGHIYFIIGRKEGHLRGDPDGILTWTNLSDGSVGVVPLSYYANSWGDPFQFGATELNGYDFSEFDAPPKPKRPTLGETFEHAMDDLRKSIKFHEGKGHKVLAAALKKDLKRMEDRWENWTP